MLIVLYTFMYTINCTFCVRMIETTYVFLTFFFTAVYRREYGLQNERNIKHY